MKNDKSPSTGESIGTSSFSELVRMLSIKEVKDKASIGHTKIYDEIRKGHLKTVKVGRRRLVTAQQFLAWQNALIEAMKDGGGDNDDQE